MRKIIFATVLISLSLAGCGGGGGGGTAKSDPFNGSGISLRSTVSYYSPIRVGLFDPLVGTSVMNMPVDDIYARDLNNSGFQEVIFGGRSTPPTDLSQWQNYNMQIFGWNSGSFKNETTAWFSGNDNQIIGTEPAVRFGDFNGNGHLDMLVSPGTDTTLYGPTMLFLNTGSSSFTRLHLNTGDIWSHDAVVADFNHDGVDDFFIADYNGAPTLVLGATDSVFKTLQAVDGPGASGVSAADFLGNGTTTMVFTDAPASGDIFDTKLYSWSAVGGELILNEEAVLPASRFNLPKWNFLMQNSDLAPHDIRNIAFDFNNNGRTDVIVFSTMPQDENAHGYSEIQFLRNDGGGVFTDVTDEILVGYNTNRTTTYQPVLMDVNNDGLMDIVLSHRDYSDQPSTTVMLQTVEGKFVESYTNVFTDFTNQIKQIETTTSNAVTGGTQAVSIVQGPNDKLYLVSGVNYTQDGDIKNAVYLAEIGSQSTVTVPATIAAIQQEWPWMSAAEVNEVLARTSPLSINNSQVIDPWAAMSPVGMLGLALDGRKGIIRPLSGYIAGVNFLSAQMRVAAFDSLRRDFQVDLTPMNVKRLNHWTRPEVHRQNFTAPSFSHAQNLVGANVSEINGYRLAQHPNDSMGMFTIGVPLIRFNENISLQSQLTMLNFSPWLQMDGVWGKVNNTLITEFVGSYRRQSFVANTGLMYAITEITPGLVTNVSNIASVWGEVGYQNTADGFAAFIGIKPWALNGTVHAKLPSSVDQQGNVQYQTVSAPIQNALDGYLRIGYTAKLHSRVRGSIGAIMFTNGLHGVMGSLSVSF